LWAQFLPNAADPGAAFTAITQLGTETAVLVYFWRDIVRIVKAWAGSLTGKVSRQDPDARMGWLVILGSLPIIVLGLLFQDQIESVLRSMWIVATMLIVFGLILAVADAVGKQERDLTCLTYKHGILYGLCPGHGTDPRRVPVRRHHHRRPPDGLHREAAARYSFLLAIPAVFGSGLFQLYKTVSKEGITGPYGLPETALATVIALVVGYVIIGWFLKFVSTRSYRLFVWYRIFLGLALYLLLGFNVISA
jgi:undecaprenyl-diphosphatase